MLYPVALGPRCGSLQTSPHLHLPRTFHSGPQSYLQIDLPLDWSADKIHHRTESHEVHEKTNLVHGVANHLPAELIALCL